MPSKVDGGGAKGLEGKAAGKAPNYGTDDDDDD